MVLIREEEKCQSTNLPSLLLLHAIFIYTVQDSLFSESGTFWNLSLTTGEIRQITHLKKSCISHYKNKLFIIMISE